MWHFTYSPNSARLRGIMQTFMPYGSYYDKTAKCLDVKRLGKQRVDLASLDDDTFDNLRDNSTGRDVRL